MRHKKKRSHVATAATTPVSGGDQRRNVDRLDYSDGSSAADSPLDSQEYQRAIRAHLNEFEDMTANPEHGYSSRNSLDEAHEAHRSGTRSPSLPPLVPVSGPKTASRKIGRPAAVNGDAEPRGKDRIWNTTTNEEKERIKAFWLNLGEEERKSLVKVEKEAVLKKMKEQQKHSCSCSVCGRKRTAIEEELEVLYDAYYEELEQYANQEQFPSQSSITSSRNHVQRAPRPGRITEVLQSDDSDGSYDEEDELSEDDLLTDDELSDENEEDYSDEESIEDQSPPEFFKFGNSLTVKGGILTVADDLLKNDGKKFIEMMEQLAERRMQREEEAAMEAREFDELDDDDYDDDDIESEDYDEDEDEQDALTEEQRMAEGRRMFQIFAARMFEQRVLTAYREKVAQERQAQLLQELEMEDSREKEREAKKLKEKEKKKDKKRQQQLKKEEEKAKKDAERLAEETAAKAEEERKAEESRKRKEELRLKKDAEKKAADAERFRKEEEKRKRLAEEKAREIKKQELAAKERKAKEEAQRKERELKEAAIKEAKIKKESAAKAQSEAAAKVESMKPAATLPVPDATASLTQTVSRKVSPLVKPASPAVGTPPAVPKSHTTGKEGQVPRLYQDPIGNLSGPRNIPGPSHQHHTMTPGMISPQQQQQFHPHQGSYPRAVLGHPPSMPVPLPPPGIGGGMHGPPTNSHDIFGFGPQAPQKGQPPMQGNQIPLRTNGHNAAQGPNNQGPPGVFSTAPGLNNSPSEKPRMNTSQNSRLPSVSAFNAFGGLGPNPGAITRDEVINDPETAFGRRPGNFAENSIGPIGAIGRPPAARIPSVLPAPIQRPTSIAPVKRPGFETRDVMGSRALLDEDDPVVDDRIPLPATSWNPTPKTDWTGSAALNGTVDEPYHPPAGDRWGAAGTIGVKTVQSDNPPLSITKSKWGF